MKTIIKMLLISAAIFAVTFKSQTAKAQAFSPADSSISITLSAQEHAFIYAFMPSRGGIDDINYITQVARQLQRDQNGNVSDTAQAITVTVSFDQVKRYYLAIGSGQERLTGYYNNIIKQDLFVQILDRPTLLNMILQVKDQSGADTEQLIHLAFADLLRIRP